MISYSLIPSYHFGFTAHVEGLVHYCSIWERMVYLFIRYNEIPSYKAKHTALRQQRKIGKYKYVIPLPG